MTREQMIDAAVRAALAGWRGDFAPWFTANYANEQFKIATAMFEKEIRKEFRRISSNADHASRDGSTCNSR